MALLVRGVSRQNGLLSVLALGSFRTGCAPHRSLATIKTFDHGHKKFQTTETSGERSLLAECSRRGHEPCEGDLECDTSQGHIWLRQCSSDDDHGTFSHLLRWYTPGSRNQDSMANETDYVELGLACTDVCKALDRGMNGRKLDDFNQSVREAIEQLTRRVKSGTHIIHNSLTTLSIAGPLRRSRKTSSRRADGIRFPDLSMQRMTRIRSRPGSWTSIGFCMSLMCVQSFLLGCR